jgi:hypothetical protein
LRSSSSALSSMPRSLALFRPGAVAVCTAWGERPVIAQISDTEQLATLCCDRSKVRRTEGEFSLGEFPLELAPHMLSAPDWIHL